MIGFFDSGIGGFTILKEVRKFYKKNKIIYLADNLNCPYGEKTDDEIYSLTLKSINFLIGKGCTLIILACNTATSVAIKRIQQAWIPNKHPEIKVLGVIRPVSETLLENKISLTEKVIILATTATIRTDFYKLELKEYGFNNTISIAAPGLASAIEDENKAEINNIVQNILQKNTKEIENSKVLVLACTHYPLASKSIQKQLLEMFPKKNILIIDQAKLTAAKLKKYIDSHSEFLPIDGGLEIYATSDSKNFELKLKRLFKIDSVVNEVKI